MPGSSSWFVVSLQGSIRFLMAGLLMVPFCWRELRSLRGSEVIQGFGLGFCGGAGMLFQMDGLAYTSASISAFLTQAYCILLMGSDLVRLNPSRCRYVWGLSHRGPAPNGKNRFWSSGGSLRNRVTHGRHGTHGTHETHMTHEANHNSNDIWFLSTRRKVSQLK
jgi:hypothetical protein